MGDIVDLDALVPQSVVIKFDGQEIEVKPPTLADILALGSLGQQMAKAGSLTPEQNEELTTDLTAYIKRIIPELKDKNLASYQLLKLVEIINGMSTPPEAKELEAKGISTDTDPKAP